MIQISGDIKDILRNLLRYFEISLKVTGVSQDIYKSDVSQDIYILFKTRRHKSFGQESIAVSNAVNT